MMNKSNFSHDIYLFLILQIENRALRLKEPPATAAQYVEESLIPSTSPHGTISNGILLPETSPRLSWDYFDEIGYIRGGRLRQGEDPYLRNRFNQQASDALPSNREIPDTRNAM